MNKKVLSIALIAALGIPATLSAKTDIYDVAVNMVRAKAYNNVAERINDLVNRTEQYILQTGDFNPTTEKVANYFNVDENTWTNFDKNGVIRISVDGNKNRFIIKNIGDSIENDETQAAIFAHKNLLDPSIYPETDRTTGDISLALTLFKPFGPVLSNFKDLVNKAESNGGIVSPTAPSDTSKTWYKPDGKGNLIEYTYNSDTKQWEKTDELKNAFNYFDESLKQSKETSDVVIAKSYDELSQNTDVLNGTLGYVIDDKTKTSTPYIFVNGKWVSVYVNNKKQSTNTTANSNEDNGIYTPTLVYDKMFIDRMPPVIGVNLGEQLYDVYGRNYVYADFLRSPIGNLMKSFIINLNNKPVVITFFKFPVFTYSSTGFWDYNWFYSFLKPSNIETPQHIILSSSSTYLPMIEKALEEGKKQYSSDLETLINNYDFSRLVFFPRRVQVNGAPYYYKINGFYDKKDNNFKFIAFKEGSTNLGKEMDKQIEFKSFEDFQNKVANQKYNFYFQMKDLNTMLKAFGISLSDILSMEKVNDIQKILFKQNGNEYALIGGYLWDNVYAIVPAKYGKDIIFGLTDASDNILYYLTSDGKIIRAGAIVDFSRGLIYNQSDVVVPKTEGIDVKYEDFDINGNKYNTGYNTAIITLPKMDGNKIIMISYSKSDGGVYILTDKHILYRLRIQNLDYKHFPLYFEKIDDNVIATGVNNNFVGHIWLKEDGSVWHIYYATNQPDKLGNIFDFIQDGVNKGYVPSDFAKSLTKEYLLNPANIVKINDYAIIYSNGLIIENLNKTATVISPKLIQHPVLLYDVLNYNTMPYIQVNLSSLKNYGETRPQNLAKLRNNLFYSFETKNLYYFTDTKRYTNPQIVKNVDPDDIIVLDNSITLIVDKQNKTIKVLGFKEGCLPNSDRYTKTHYSIGYYCNAIYGLDVLKKEYFGSKNPKLMFTDMDFERQ